jgi:hypothetical protein
MSLQTRLWKGTRFKHTKKKKWEHIATETRYIRYRGIVSQVSLTVSATTYISTRSRQSTRLRTDLALSAREEKQERKA